MSFAVCSPAHAKFAPIQPKTFPEKIGDPGGRFLYVVISQVTSLSFAKDLSVWEKAGSHIGVAVPHASHRLETLDIKILRLRFLRWVLAPSRVSTLIVVGHKGAEKPSVSIAVLMLVPHGFADIANYHAGNFRDQKDVNPAKRKFFKDQILTSSKACHSGHGGHYGANVHRLKIFDSGFLLATDPIRIPMTFVNRLCICQVRKHFRNVMRCHKTLSKFAKSLTFGALILWGRSRLQEGTNIYSWPSITCQNGLKRKHSPPMTPELFANFLNLSSPDLDALSGNLK
ncbi:hypothetical protein Tco_0853145 [Tanacetum coccineum]